MDQIFYEYFNPSNLSHNSTRKETLNPVPDLSSHNNLNNVNLNTHNLINQDAPIQRIIPKQTSLNMNTWR